MIARLVCKQAQLSAITVKPTRGIEMSRMFLPVLFLALSGFVQMPRESVPHAKSKPTNVSDVSFPEYSLDDGSAESSTGLFFDGGTLVWLNQFNVVERGELLTDIQVAWGRMPGGGLAKLLVFHDPNGDGDPSDLTQDDLLRASLIVATPDPQGAFVNYPISEVHLGDTGASFFIGVCIGQDQFSTPAAYDEAQPPIVRSWIAGDLDGVGFDCFNPNTAGIVSLVSWDYGYWMIRGVARNIVSLEAVSWSAVKKLYESPGQ